MFLRFLLTNLQQKLILGTDTVSFDIARMFYNHVIADYSLTLYLVVKNLIMLTKQITIRFQLNVTLVKLADIAKVNLSSNSGMK